MSRPPCTLFRVLLLGASAALPSACSWAPGLSDPQVRLSGRYYIYQLEGRARMQSIRGGSIVENGPASTSQLGQNHRGNDIGGVLEIGDGFSGLELEYQHVDLHDTSTGVLTSDFGQLPTGTRVSSQFRQDEYRLTYIAEVLDHEFQVDDEEYLRLRFGPGAAIVHREGDFKVWQDGFLDANENMGFADHGVPYLSLRGRVEWRNVSLQFDWDYNPDFTFGGDIEGHLHDVEVLGRYTLEAQDITFLAGYRWSDIKASGSANELRYDMDVDLVGYVLGVEFGF